MDVHARFTVIAENTGAKHAVAERRQANQQLRVEPGVRRRDDGAKVSGHACQSRLRNVGQGVTRQDSLLLIGVLDGPRKLPGFTFSAASASGRYLSAAKEVLHDAAVHVEQFWRSLRVVLESGRRRVREDRPAGDAAEVRRFQEGDVHRTSWKRELGGVRAAIVRIRRELLHGWPGSGALQGDAEEDRAAHQVLPTPFVYHARGRRAGKVREKVRWDPLHLELRGNYFPMIFTEDITRRSLFANK